MTSTSIDDQYWLAYTKAITAKVLGSGLKNTDGNKSYFFVASDANRSVPASMFIPNATTNNWLYPAADALLDPKKVIYSPVDKTSYFGAVRDYMLNVDMSDPNDTSEGAQERQKVLNKKLASLRDELFDAEQRKEKYEDVAKNRYEKYLKENTEAQAFTIWASENAKVYLDSLDEVKAVSGQVKAKQMEKSGPMSALWSSQIDRFNSLMSPLVQLPGISMACYDQPTGNVEAQLEKIKHTRPETVVPVPEPSPSTCFYRPLYTIDPTYREIMDRWTRDFELGQAKGGGSMSFTIDEEKQNSWKDFGFEETKGSGGISYFGLFRVGASGGKTEFKETISAEKSTSKISFDISWNDMQFFNVQAGTWNVPNLKQSYPRTLPSYTAKYESFVRPTQLLCASGLSIKTVVSGSMRKELNEKIEKAKSISGDGSVRIGLFGFDASIGHTSKESKESSTVDWNAETGELVFKPTKTFGSSVLVGVMCQDVV